VKDCTLSVRIQSFKAGLYMSGVECNFLFLLLSILTVSVNERQQMGLMQSGFVAGSFLGHEEHSPRQCYIFKH